MIPGKPTKTLADYLVIAISPALIILLVHSVCFFLVDIFYRSETVTGVRWVLFWFVLATVLITRIGIEQGDGPAMLYGLLLAGVTWLYLSVVQTSALFGAILLAVVWFTAHKITCNCTLVDDDADASGQGLMQSLRDAPALLKKRLSRSTPAPKGPPPAKKKHRPQIPGVWLLYFSAAALPIFGLGQTLLPANDLAARHRGIVFLFCYLAAALGLLIATSFLGLRRYLRQRYVTMPANIAFGWIQFGAMGAVLVLLLSLLLPRPGAGEAWISLRYHIDHQIRRASDYAARFNPHGSGKGRTGNEAPPNAQPPNNPSPSGSVPTPGQNNNNNNPNSKNPNDQPTGPAANQGTTGNQASGENPGEPSQAIPPPPGPAFAWLKALFYLAAAVGIIWLLNRYRALIASVLQSAWTAIRNFMAELMGLFKSRPTTPTATASTKPILPFRHFQNPFQTGAHEAWPPEELITYTYDAVKSWALENAATPQSPQTPSELCNQLADEMPELASALNHLAFLYGHVVYGASVPAYVNRDHLRILWTHMARPRPNVQMTNDE